MLSSAVRIGPKSHKNTAVITKNNSQSSDLFYAKLVYFGLTIFCVVDVHRNMPCWATTFYILLLHGRYGSNICLPSLQNTNVALKQANRYINYTKSSQDISFTASRLCEGCNHVIRCYMNFERFQLQFYVQIYSNNTSVLKINKLKRPNDRFYQNILGFKCCGEIRDDRCY